MRRLCALLMFAACGTCGAAQAQTPIQFGTGSVSIAPGGAASFESFDSLASSGSSSSLPVGWYASEAGTSSAVNGQYTASEGSANGGDIYSFGGARQTDRALGTLSSGTLTPIIGVRFTNTTGATLTGGSVSYSGELWRRGAVGRSDQLSFQYSTNATSLNTGTWSDASTLSYSSPTGSTLNALDGNANRTPISGTLSGLSVADGSDVWFRWVDLPLSGSNDGMGIDDFSFTPNSPVPEPASVGLIAAAGLGAAALMRRRRRAKGGAA